ncbi:hypothetical protein GYMLUDRAFT_62090 [Collybiopsis luxurians FD-317 M1]|uniref:Uncharacterized protein n=1 Tax=Collybiopsis luxurians FD-317 M1 TaxID=944289 RepID=A0A0D0AZR0_9AGAR|nr:hypothetical protein GYMLUDRAFT_62090 [Collybiopsis luxurians FD-317 M1]
MELDSDKTLVEGVPGTSERAHWENPSLFTGSTYKPHPLIHHVPPPAPGLLSPAQLTVENVQSVTGQYRALHEQLTRRCQVLQLDLQAASTTRKLAKMECGLAQEWCKALEKENEHLCAQISSLQRNMHTSGLNILHLAEYQVVE